MATERRPAKKQHKAPKPVPGVGEVLLNADGACDFIGCTRATLLSLEERGLITPIRLSKTMVRYRSSDLAKLGESA